MRIGGPIQFWRVCVIYLQKKIEVGLFLSQKINDFFWGGGGGSGAVNKRLGSDQVT